jgi:hypothetical protein
MIDLRKLVYYEFIDDETVEVFDRYKWGLEDLGVNFTEEVGEIIIAYSYNLENSLRAFCAWILRRKQQGEKFTEENVTQILIDAIKSGWIPTEFQEKFLSKNSNILENPRNLIWERSAKILGYDLRNKVIFDVTEEGKIIFRENLTLSDDDWQKITTLKSYKNTLDIIIDLNTSYSESNQIKAAGLLESHYAPKAKVFLTGSPILGDGFIALASFATPAGAVRIAAPKTNEEFAQILYEAFRLTDTKGLERVFVIPPTGDGIAVAINDRLTKSAFDKWIN